ncbi:Dihydropteroate synthase-like protein [Kockovaella imperatae]|uniref:Dihydropteroate synthase-like protein n=1 Tax=Kockovaella imperatae TaxID=4999 RepID=A0A1Y1UTP4_9TREE|nr:Dihydropteroate synthase-like protein [Kockovaella imperatae]ORX40894.1 Dihydropteroate synthase-like protein [Kockovaella imperatae]
MTHPHISDQIMIADLALHLPTGLGPSAFNLNPPPPCPANLSLSISVNDNVVPSCVVDDTQGGLGIDYSSLSKEILALSSSQAFNRPDELLDAVERLVKKKGVVRGLQMNLELPRASLKAGSIVYSRIATSGAAVRSCQIRNLKVMTIVGLRSYERQHKQWLELDVRLHGCAETWDHVKVAEETYNWVEQSNYGTIEALVDELALHFLTKFEADLNPRATIDVTLRKPSALPFATPGVSIHRTLEDYDKRASGSDLAVSSGLNVASTPTKSHLREGHDGSGLVRRIFIGLGSNIGDRKTNISRAIDILSAQDVSIVRHSRLYESEPMYHEDQERFMNAVVEIRSSLSPEELLRRMKKAEREVGRTKTFRNGPRVVDLDLLVYGDEVVKVGDVDCPEDENGVGWLRCPHPSIAEREFVLRPLADLAPDLVLPQINRSAAEMLKTHPTTLVPLLAFPLPASRMRLTQSPKIMQIFNATPDSFSDGSEDAMDPVLALQTITKLLDDGFAPDILDVGGQSTRPGAIMSTESEELSRVIPLIQAIRNSHDLRLKNIPISIDTFRPLVAQAAVKAGACCINDVRGGTERGMLQVMASCDVPVVLMHSRGDSTSMLTSSAKDYSALGGVVEGVKFELGLMVQRALEAGVKAWNIVIDPGLGFAKGMEENLTLLKHLPDLVAPGSPLHGYPLLIGGSRKRFVGQVTGREQPTERMFGDAAVVGRCLASGVVDIVRVHEGRGMGEVIKMWEAIDSAT